MWVDYVLQGNTCIAQEASHKKLLNVPVCAPKRKGGVSAGTLPASIWWELRFFIKNTDLRVVVGL